jgi:putative transposase
MFDMTKVVKRAYKYRFYPTPEQAAELTRTFGCVRKVWNLALQARTTAWHQRHEHVSYLQSSAMLTRWKHSDDLGYLNEVSSVPLQQALRHLQSAFTRFWDGQARYPKLKSRKRSRASAEYTRSAFRYRDGRLHLAKMTAPLAVVWSRPLPDGAEPSTVTVSRDPAGRWYVSLLCQCAVEPHPASATVVGVDAGITSLATLSTGEKIPNPRHERRDRARLALAQRRLARKALGSANRDKARLKVARVHARISDRRRDFLHQLTTRLVRDNQAVVIEDLSVRNMVRNHHLARAISDAAWRQMRTLLAYKCEWYGRDLVVIDRWYPSSTTCSGCGRRAGPLPLDVREWECMTCGARHDRDINAAVNIRAAGLAVLACGAGIRPAREPSRGHRDGGPGGLSLALNTSSVAVQPGVRRSWAPAATAAGGELRS